MFYIKEIIFRFQYLGFSFCIITILCWFNKDLLLFILTFNVLTSNIKSNLAGIDYFIYTHPSELLMTYISVILYFTFIFTLPQLFWHCLDFSKSSLKFSEYLNACQIIKGSSTIIYLLNIFCFLFLFPTCWTLFESFNQIKNLSTSLTFFLELKIQDYMSFLKDFLHNTNICLILLLGLHFILNFYGLKNLLYWRRSFLLINLVFATLLSPPDVFSQTLNTVILVFFFELTTFKRTLEFKSCKYVRFSVRHHVE
jgi:sec-independent protein translocase protein TatC